MTPSICQARDLLSDVLVLGFTVIFIAYWTIDITIRVFSDGLQDQGSILGQVIPKTQKNVLDASLLNTQHYKVWIKGE